MTKRIKDRKKISLVIILFTHTEVKKHPNINLWAGFEFTVLCKLPCLCLWFQTCTLLMKL